MGPSRLTPLAPENTWKPAFLAALEKAGNVSTAAATVGITRQCAYQARDRDARFREAWDVAIEAATDALEAEARRRALEGTDEPVFFKGEICGNIRKYSDTLMIVLLKAHRPDKFRERVQAEHSGELTVRVVYDDGDHGPTAPPASEAGGNSPAGEPV